MSGIYTQSITLSGDYIEITLENAYITAQMPIHISGGSAVIHVVGKNNNLMFTGVNANIGNGGIYLDGNASVTIEGDGVENSHLTISNPLSETQGPAIGPSLGYCGNITISNVSLKLYGGDRAAAIGTGGQTNHAIGCGNITITDSAIEAYPGSNAAAIGFGYFSPYSGISGTIGDITITNTTLTGKAYSISNAAIVGDGGMNVPRTVGNISIVPPDPTTTPADYFKSFIDAGAGNLLVDYNNDNTSNSYTVNWNGVDQGGNITQE